jgi:hypothetical protein
VSASAPEGSDQVLVRSAPTTHLVQQAASVRLRKAVRSLPVGRERNRGYDRDKFGDWVDADRDCRDTRDEVFAQESRTRVSGCDIRSGRSVSYYDRRVWSHSSDVDIDHMVPLAEAWGSGARWHGRDPPDRWVSETCSALAPSAGGSTAARENLQSPCTRPGEARPALRSRPCGRASGLFASVAGEPSTRRAVAAADIADDR